MRNESILFKITGKQGIYLTHGMIRGSDALEAMDDARADEMENKESYWQERCRLAEKCLEVSPCDPDITQEQIMAHSVYNNFLNTVNKPIPPKQ